MPTPYIETDSIYSFAVIADTEQASDWLTQAVCDGDDLRGTFEAARDLARDLDSRVVLRDEAGFERGHINADGSWRMY
jgi:hypothetical protein